MANQKKTVGDDITAAQIENDASNAVLEKHRTISTQAVIRVGEGRGFVVEHGYRHERQRVVITAAHCLPFFPLAHPGSYLQERTYRDLLAPLGASPTVWAECLFADPIADVAVLGSPDDQALFDQADAYEQLMAGSTALTIIDAPKMGRERVQGFGDYSFEVDTPGSAPAYLFVAGGMSGSPILSLDGRAIALMSTGGQNPILRQNLPAWFFRRRHG
jgi:hypothetical protein